MENRMPGFNPLVVGSIKAVGCILTSTLTLICRNPFRIRSLTEIVMQYIDQIKKVKE